MKTILATLLVLFAAVGARAQTPIKVWVFGNGSDAQEITNRLKAKIGGTSRYALSDNPEVSLRLEVHCIPMHFEGGPVTGYACNSVVTYFPDMGSLSMHLFGAEMLVSCNASGEYCAEALFDAFVNGAQPDKLAAAKSELQKSVDQYIQSKKPKK